MSVTRTSKSSSEANNPINHVVFHDLMVVPTSDLASDLAKQGFGTLRANGSLTISTLEAHFLHEKKTIIVTNERGTALTTEQIERRAGKTDKQFAIRAAVYGDLRRRGYVVKSALRYGAEFRVYDRGVKPGDDHSRWIVYPVHERASFGWHDFASKNRIAHGTQKRLLLGIVDDEGEVLYYEVRWLRP